jgi:hypothetical protein
MSYSKKLHIKISHFNGKFSKETDNGRDHLLLHINVTSRISHCCQKNPGFFNHQSSSMLFNANKNNRSLTNGNASTLQHNLRPTPVFGMRYTNGEESLANEQVRF